MLVNGSVWTHNAHVHYLRDSLDGTLKIYRLHCLTKVSLLHFDLPHPVHWNGIIAAAQEGLAR